MGVLHQVLGGCGRTPRCAGRRSAGLDPAGAKPRLLSSRSGAYWRADMQGPQRRLGGTPAAEQEPKPKPGIAEEHVDPSIEAPLEHPEGWGPPWKPLWSTARPKGIS